jgi:hypothetical protein
MRSPTASCWIRCDPASLRGAQPERKEEDVFPAFYRLNTRRDISRLFPEPRFRQASYYWDASPSYHFETLCVPAVFVAAQCEPERVQDNADGLQSEKPIADRRRRRSLFRFCAALGPPTS